MLRVVLDTVVFVRALLNPHSRSGRLIFRQADRFALIVSKPTAQELLEVIQRPELAKKYKSLNQLGIEQLIDLVSQAEAVEIGIPRAIVRDPKDDIFIATALAGDADYIVSADQDLLTLKDSAGVPIITTEKFLALLDAEG